MVLPAGVGVRRFSIIADVERVLQGVIAIAALVPLAIGLRWLQLMLFTDYRSHLRPVLIPIGLVAVAVGLVMLLAAAIPLLQKAAKRK